MITPSKLSSPNLLNSCAHIPGEVHILWVKGSYSSPYRAVKYFWDRGFRNTGMSTLVGSFCLLLKAVNNDALICNVLFQVDAVLRHSINPTSLPTISAIIIYNDTVLWTGNFGKRNGSDPKSPPPNEYTIYR